MNSLFDLVCNFVCAIAWGNGLIFVVKCSDQKSIKFGGQHEMLRFLNCQIYLLNSVAYFLFALRNELTWLECRNLKEFSVRPMYVSCFILSSLFTVAW